MNELSASRPARPTGGSFPPPQLPRDYLAGGYFDEQGAIRRELLGELAKSVAKILAQGKPELTNGQFRRFYDHARAVEQRLNLLEKTESQAWRLVEGDIEKLKAFAAEARAKNKVPVVFYDFIVANVNATRNSKDFRKGFIEHMQAVLAFHAYEKPRRS